MRSTSRSRAVVGPVGSDTVELDLLVAEPAQHLDVLAQRAGEAVALEVGRPQLEDERAQLVERLPRQRLQPADPLARRRRVAVEQRRRRLGLEHEAEQLLADGVVELEREPVALGDDRELARLARTGARS